MLSKGQLTLARNVFQETQILAPLSIRMLLVPHWSDVSTVYATMDRLWAFSAHVHLVRLSKKLLIVIDMHSQTSQTSRYEQSRLQWSSTVHRRTIDPAGPVVSMRPWTVSDEATNFLSL